MSLTDPCPWIVAEIDDLQDTVEDLEVKIEEVRDQRDTYHDLMDGWQSRFNKLNRTLHDKIQDANLKLRDKSVIYLDLIEEYDREISKSTKFMHIKYSNVKINHLRKKGEIDL